MLTKFFSEWIQRIQNQSFMFTELVKRDFKQKYKRSMLGMGLERTFTAFAITDYADCIHPILCTGDTALHSLFVCWESYVCLFQGIYYRWYECVDE